MEAEDSPGGLKAAQLCFPPPIRMGIAYTLHALIFCLPFAFINPLLGIAFIALVYLIGFGYTWPKGIRGMIEASFGN